MNPTVMPIIFRPIHNHNHNHNTHAPIHAVFNGANYYQPVPKTVTGVQININGNQYVNNGVSNGVVPGVFAYPVENKSTIILRKNHF